MRSLVMLSFPFLLAGMLAVTTMGSSADNPLKCHKLDPKDNHLKQMRECEGDMLEFSSDPTVAFVLTGLDQATADDIFFVKKMKNGKRVPNMEKPKKLSGSITIRDSTMERLTLDIGAAGPQQVVTVVNNLKLNKFTLRTNPLGRLNIDLTVKGNKRLSMPSINKLPKVRGVTLASIQEYQECFFDSAPIKNISELDGCAGIDGDLVIDSQTNTANIPPNLGIEKIRNGCLRIENSNLTSLHFFKELLDGQTPKTCSDGSQNHFIKGNTQLCLTSEEQLRWKEYQLTYAGTCEDRCTAEFAKTNPTAPCTTVTGDIKITSSVDPAELQSWDRVTVIEGTLEVDNTDLTDMVIFKNLTKIDNPSIVKRALAVTRNKKMEKFDLPQLAYIEQPSDSSQAPVLFHQNNDKFKLPWREYERWQKITKLDNPSLPHFAKPAPPTTPSPPTPSTRSPEEIRKQNVINEEANKEMNKNAIIILISLGAVGCLLLLFVCICGCYVCKGLIVKKQKRVDHDAIVKKSSDKKPVVQADLPNVRRRPVEREELTLATNARNYRLNITEEDLLDGLDNSYQECTYAKFFQICLHATEMPFKMSDMFTSKELDFNRPSQSTLDGKTPPNSYRFIETYRLLAYNPKLINRQTPERMEKFDPHAVLKALLTNCNEFFVTNAHLMPDTIKYLTGPHYGCKGKNLLAKIDGDVICMTDIHSTLDTLQVILNINFNENNDNKPKVHPAFCQKYVILGDLVDRGDFGLECSVLVCLLARLFPGNFVVLRGNHDQRMVSMKEDERRKEKNTINTYGEALKASGKFANPYHFADCMYWDYLENVVGHMPYACLINGKVFASHGGMSSSMLRMEGTLDELFEKVPVPYLEKVYVQQEGYDRYFGNATSDQIKKEEGMPAGKGADEYTEKLKKRQQDLCRFMNGYKPDDGAEKVLGYDEYEILARKSKNFERNLNFEILNPWLFELVWSDPGTILAAYGNTRFAGNTYSYENVAEFCEKFGIDYIVRGHQTRFCVSPDGRVVNIYSNPHHLISDSKQDSRGVESQSVDPENFASIVRINADGSRTFVFIALGWEKAANQALLKMDIKLQKELEHQKKNMLEERQKRKAELLARKRGKKSNGGEKSQSKSTASSKKMRKSRQRSIKGSKKSSQRSIKGESKSAGSDRKEGTENGGVGTGNKPVAAKKQRKSKQKSIKGSTGQGSDKKDKSQEVEKDGKKGGEEKNQDKPTANDRKTSKSKEAA